MDRRAASEAEINARRGSMNAATTATTGEGRADLAYQRDILPKVSRTFALTIPQLPDPLSEAIGNAYLLCRIADTVEDEPALSAQDKQAFLERFIEVVEGRAPAPAFAGELSPRLSTATIDAERELVTNTPKVIRVTHRLRPVQREALERCVRIMSLGMAEFQRNATPDLPYPPSPSLPLHPPPPIFQTIPLSMASVILAIQYHTKITRLAWLRSFSLTVLVILLCLGDSNNLITLVTELSNFTLWPVFYLPVVVGFVCLFAIILKGIW